MAIADYGAIVIKNGIIINENEWFQDMKREVGWSDNPFRERYIECDFYVPYECMAKRISNCYVCPKAKYEEGEKPAIEDCKGVSLRNIKYLKYLVDPKNYFAYIGDKELTIGFYKTVVSFFINGEKIDFSTISDHSFEDNVSRKSIHFSINNTKINIKKIGDCQYYLSMTYKNNRYFVIYGYGIDSNIRFWRDYKSKYLGKKKARVINNIITTHAKLNYKQFLIDDELDIIYNINDFTYRFIRFKYGITEPIENQCWSNKDFCDTLNMYFGFKKFDIKYYDQSKIKITV